MSPENQIQDRYDAADKAMNHTEAKGPQALLDAMTKERDALLETIRYCTSILHAAEHDQAAPLEAMVRRSIAYGNRMEAERDAERAARKALVEALNRMSVDCAEDDAIRKTALALAAKLPA